MGKLTLDLDSDLAGKLKGIGDTLDHDMGEIIEIALIYFTKINSAELLEEAMERQRDFMGLKGKDRNALDLSLKAYLACKIAGMITNEQIQRDLSNMREDLNDASWTTPEDLAKQIENETGKKIDI